jgi:hypothetical protein
MQHSTESAACSILYIQGTANANQLFCSVTHVEDGSPSQRGFLRRHLAPAHHRTAALLFQRPSHGGGSIVPTPIIAAGTSKQHCMTCVGTAQSESAGLSPCQKLP